MYSKKQKSYITVPKNNQDIKENIENNKNKNKHDYETIRNIVLEKSNNNIKSYNKDKNKPTNNKFDIV